MTAAEVLEALSAHGVRVLLGENGRPEADIPQESATEIEGLLVEARAHREEIAAELRRNAPACPSCGATVTPDLILCAACYAARRAPGRILAFDPDRRRRTEARLAGRQCPDCQTTDWYVSPRGDAACRTCARRRAGGAA